jgi:hypothetical protein
MYLLNNGSSYLLMYFISNTDLLSPSHVAYLWVAFSSVSPSKVVVILTVVVHVILPSPGIRWNNTIPWLFHSTFLPIHYLQPPYHFSFIVTKLRTWHNIKNLCKDLHSLSHIYDISCLSLQCAYIVFLKVPPMQFCL